MLVTLCTHNGDRPLTLSLAKQIRDLGGVNTHEALIVCPTGTDLSGIEDALRKVFLKVHVHFYAETMRGWPYGANEAAYHAMMHIHSSPELLYHYLMLEPDCVIRPTRSDWLNRIDQEYRTGGKPVLGVVIPTMEIESRRVVGRHTVGVAVWPKLWPKICPLVKSLKEMTDGFKRQNSMPMPWDAYFGPYSARNTAETQSILHLVRGYTRDERGMRWDCPDLNEAARQVTPNALLIHGSKNPSFLAHLNGEKPDAKKSSSTPKPQKNDSGALLQKGQPHGENRPQSAGKKEIDPYEEQSDRDQQAEYPEEADRDGQEIAQVRGAQGSAQGTAKSVEKGGDAAQEVKLTKQQIHDQRRDKRAEEKRLQNHESLRQEWEIEFPLDSLECKRAFEMHGDQKLGWHQLKDYAKNIGIPIEAKWKKNRIVNEVVRAERDQGTMPWTKMLVFHPAPVPIEDATMPALEVSAVQPALAQWTPLADNATGVPVDTGMSDLKREQMRKLYQARTAAGQM